MVDGDIDPKSVEAMENFKRYAEESQQSMKTLQQTMDKFTASMAMTKTHTTDLRESLRQIGTTEPFKQMEDSIKGVQTGLEKTKTRNQNPTAQRVDERRVTDTEEQDTSNVTVNLRIDVSGITDKTDKRKLAKEISAMVTQELRTKMGGPTVNSGFSRRG